MQGIYYIYFSQFTTAMMSLPPKIEKLNMALRHKYTQFHKELIINDLRLV